MRSAFVETRTSPLTARGRAAPLHRVARAACAVLLTVASSASAITYDESVDGDLGPFDAPTVLALDIGSNTVIGAVGPSDTDRYDAFAPSVGTISAIILDGYANPGGFGDFTSVLFGVTDLGTVVSGSDFDVDSIGTDLLTLLPSTPIGETIVAYVLDEQNSTATYELDVQTVPEPAAPCLIALGAIALAIRRWAAA